MCGIFMEYCNESVPRLSEIDVLFKSAETRGSDGVGVAIFDPKDVYSTKIYQNEKSYSECKEQVLDFIQKNLKQNYIIFGICRNMPETESSTNKDNLKKTMQPIFRDDVILIHNGVITDNQVNKLKKHNEFQTEIDSEAIIANYLKHNRNMKNCSEDLEGGWSFLLYDFVKQRLHIGSSFLPLAQSYARGMGYFIHSNLDGLFKLLQLYKGFQEIKYMRTWEDFYADELQPYTLYELDIDSMLVSSYEYKHKFNHPTWKPKKKNTKIKTFVLASGGIDSTTTLAYLKEHDYNPVALHFRYGQKSQEAETLAVKKICEKLDIEMKIVDISDIYKNISKSSMLMNENIDIQTAGDLLKSTIAWVPARNAMFLTIASAYCDETILNNQVDKCLIAGGFPNISEESCLIDCKENLIKKATQSLETGNSKEIHECYPGDIKEGDYIVTLDKDGKEVLTQVKEVFVTKHLGFYEIVIDTPICGEAKTIYVSANHPFAVKKRTSEYFIKAKDLEIGDKIVCSKNYYGSDDKEFPIVYIRYHNIPIDMINFHCEPYNTFLVSGYLTHNSYPDNSQRFVDAFHNFIKFGTLGGAQGRIKFVNPFAGLTKKEELYLLKYLGYEELFNLTVSCDNAKVMDGEVYQCSYNGQPACGSGLLSKWAAEIVGISDNRKYYEVENPVEIHIPKWNKKDIKFDINEIIKKVNLCLK